MRYDVTQHVRGVVGYDFLYMSNVLRPGAQIDRNINPTQNFVLGGTGGLLVGPPALWERRCGPISGRRA